MIKKITKEKHWQIVGLMELAKTTLTRLNDIELSMKNVFEVKKEDEEVCGLGNPQHIGDAIYSEYSVDTLLQKLGIEKLHNDIN